MDLTCHQCFSVYVDMCLGLTIHLYQQYFCYTNAWQRIRKNKKIWVHRSSTLLNNARTNLYIVFHPSKLHFFAFSCLKPLPVLWQAVLTFPSLSSCLCTKAWLHLLHRFEKGEKTCQTNETRHCTTITAGKVHRLPPEEAVVKFY